MKISLEKLFAEINFKRNSTFIVYVEYGGLVPEPVLQEYGAPKNP